VAASIVDRCDLNISVIPSPIGLLVFDAHVGEMDLVIEVREVVVVRPFLDLVRLAIRASVGIVPVAIPFVQPPLVLTLEFVVEGDAIDAGAALREALGFTEVRPIHLGVVFQLARLLEARIELLVAVVPMVLAMAIRVVAAVRLEHVPTLLRQHDGHIPMSVQPFGSDESFLAQMAEVT
jgi:hypothetical protein